MFAAADGETMLVFWGVVFLMLVACAIHIYKFCTDPGYRRDHLEHERHRGEQRQKKFDLAGTLAKMFITKRFGK